MASLESVVEPVCESVFDCVGNIPVVALRRLFPGPDVEVIAKLELLNPGGSMEDRSARHIVETGLREGSIAPGNRLIESSSGNFGIALAIAARLHDLRFTCVVDPKTTRANVAILRGLGDAARGCRELLLAEGIFAGGSTGAVVSAIARALPRLPRPCRVVTIFPDRGDRYLDLVYDDDWLAAAAVRRDAAYG